MKRRTKRTNARKLKRARYAAGMTMRLMPISVRGAADCLSMGFVHCGRRHVVLLPGPLALLAWIRLRYPDVLLAN